MKNFEKQLHRKNYQYIVGVDEAGRGSIAGPVVCAAVYIPLTVNINGIKDSKTLNAKKRIELFKKMKKNKNIIYDVSIQNNKVIDETNIVFATLNGMKKATLKVNRKMQINNKKDIDIILIDGNLKPSFYMLPNTKCKAIIQGDSKIFCIAAASIIAKVVHDDIMIKLDQQYPVYKFKQNKGYPTVYHKNMILQKGPCDVHRFSFNPVKKWCIQKKIKKNKIKQSLLEIQNIQDLPSQMIFKIHSFLTVHENMISFGVCTIFKSTFDKFGLQGIKEFDNTKGIAYKYYCNFDILLKQKMQFRMLKKISFTLQTLYDVIFVKQLILHNAKCLSHLLVRNCFLKNQCIQLNEIGMIIKNKNLTRMIKLKCINFSRNTLMWILPFVKNFEQIFLTNCKINKKILIQLAKIQNTVYLNNVIFDTINYNDFVIIMRCENFKIEITKDVTNISPNYKLILKNIQNKIYINVNVKNILSVLPNTFCEKCEWHIFGFQQLYIFLIKYQTRFFKQLQICQRLNYNNIHWYYKELTAFAQILTKCNNYKKLISSEPFIEIRQLHMLMFKINQLIIENKINIEHLNIKIDVLYVINDMNTIGEAQDAIKELKQQYKFLNKIIYQILIIDN